MLQIKNLTKVYKPKKGAEVLALDNVTLDFPETGLVFLLGKSGSGKSTLLNLLGGLDSYTNGEIIIQNNSSKNFKQSDFDAYRNTYIGFIFQEFFILEDYSVAKNIGIALELQGKKADKAAVEHILQEVDLDGYAERKPTEISGGQKQRVAIARALIKDPQIILADEPTGSLDSNVGKQIFQTLKKLSKNKLVIVVSHDRENAETYADRIIELKDGKVIEDVVKTTLQSEQADISFSDNAVIIKAGYSLNEQDTKAINAMLMSAKNDVVISFDDSNKNVLTSDTKRVKTSYSPTKDVKLKEYDSSKFKLIKSRFPFKDSLKMGASGLKHKKIRLAFTILLSFIAFAMFGIADTMAAFDVVKTNVATTYDAGYKVVSMSYQSGYKDEKGKEYWYEINGNMPLKDSDLSWINSQFTNSYPVMSGESLDLVGHYRDFNWNTMLNDNLLVHNLNGFVKINTVSDLNNLSLTLVAGELPSKNQILISDLIAENFIKYGYCQEKQASMIDKDIYDDYGDIPMDIVGGVDVNTYDDLKGKALQYGEQIFTISGVVSTQYDIKQIAEQYKENPFTSNIQELTSSIAAVGFISADTTINSNNNYQGASQDTNPTKVYVKLNMSASDAERLIKEAHTRVFEIEESGYFEVYRLDVQTFFNEPLVTFDMLINILEKVFRYMSIAFSVFSFLLLMNFISISIANKRKEIGILRAIGARGADVYSIFFNESLIIAAINLTLAVIATFFVANAFNKLIGISVMVVGIRQILLMAAMSITVAVVGSFLPIYRFVKKKPIETINNR